MEIKELANVPNVDKGLHGTMRFQFLDFIRFIAAFSVLLQHTLERAYQDFVWFSTNYFQFGVFGVTLFFLSSGYIIPVSLERHSSLKKFWIGRLFRLYPLLITSIILTLSFSQFGLIAKVDFSFPILLANLSMLAKFLGQPLINGLYWTLNLEMIFYIGVSILFFFNFLNKSFFVAIVALIVALFLGVVGTRLLNLYSNGWGLSFYLATMFVGTVFYRKSKNQTSRDRFSIVLILSVFTLLCITYFNLYGHDQESEIGASSFWPVTNAWIMAYILFSLSVKFRTMTYPSSFVYLGAISYSLYLMQASVIPIVFKYIESPLLQSSVTIFSTILLSSITYELVEKPFIKFGKKIR